MSGMLIIMGLLSACNDKKETANKPLIIDNYYGDLVLEEDVKLANKIFHAVILSEKGVDHSSLNYFNNDESIKSTITDVRKQFIGGKSPGELKDMGYEFKFDKVIKVFKAEELQWILSNVILEKDETQIANFYLEFKSYVKDGEVYLYSPDFVLPEELIDKNTELDEVIAYAEQNDEDIKEYNQVSSDIYKKNAVVISEYRTIIE